MSDVDEQIESLLEGARIDSIEARGRLLTALHGRLCAMAHRLIGQRAGDPLLSASDLVQETSIRILQGKPLHCENRRSLYGLLRTIMRHTLVDKVRERGAMKHGGRILILCGDHSLDLVQMRGDGDFAFGTLGDDDGYSRLQAAMEWLQRESPEHAEVIRLRFYASLERDHVARLLELSVSTVTRRVHQALQKLSQWLCNKRVDVRSRPQATSQSDRASQTRSARNSRTSGNESTRP